MPDLMHARPRVRRALWAVALFAAFSVIACNGGNGDPPAITSEPTLTPGAVGTISASGQIAFISADGELSLTDPDGTAVQVLSSFDGVIGFEWSPTGSLIATEVQGDGGVRVSVLMLDGAEVFELGSADRPLWSPSGDRLAVQQVDDVLVVDVQGQEIITLSSARRPEWSPDGTQLAYLELDEDGLALPVIVTLADGAKSDFPGDIDPVEPVYPISWHPAGALLAYRNALYEPATDSVQPLDGVPVSWSPDGRLLLQTRDLDRDTGSTGAELLDFSQDGQVIVGLDVRPSTTGESPWLYIRRWIDWTADGRTLLYMDPNPFAIQVRIYDTIDLRQERYRNIRGDEPEISPSGEHVAFFDRGDDGDEVKVWVLALDASALVDIVEGTHPAWQPQP